MTKPEENIFAEERKKMIVEHVNANVKATVAELCSIYSVSSATIRNDLRELEESGLLKRTHGGAISNKTAHFEPNSYEKAVERVEQKIAIAKAALDFVSEGDTIALDTGTTTFELAKLLTRFRNLTVVTNDLQIAAYLERNSKAEIIVAGGRVRRNFHCTAGEKAIYTISDLNVDRSFIAANGISLDKGITTPNVDTAQIKKVIIGLADHVVLLADSTKLRKTSFVRFANLEQVDVFLTDEEADEAYLEEIRKKDVDVRVCKGQTKGKSENKQE